MTGDQVDVILEIRESNCVLLMGKKIGNFRIILAKRKLKRQFEKLILLEITSREMASNTFSLFFADFTHVEVTE